MERDEQVLIRVTTERKQKWKDYAENSDEHTNLSELVRDSVYNEITDSETPDLLKSQTVDLDPVSNQLDQIESQIENLSNRMSRVEAAERNDPRSTLSLDIRDMLPSRASADEIREIENIPSRMDLGDRIKAFGRVKDIVRYFRENRDAREQEVYSAIDKLVEDLSNVHRVEVEYDDMGVEPSDHLVVVR